MITTKVSKLDIFKNGKKIGYINCENDKWVSWMIINKLSIIITYQCSPHNYKTQQLAIDALVEEYESN